VAVEVVRMAVAPDEVPRTHEGFAAQVGRAPVAPVALVRHAAVEHRDDRAAAARGPEAGRERPRVEHVDPVLAEEVPLVWGARVVREIGRGVGAPVRDRVLDVRVLLELRDRPADRAPVLDRELLGASRQPGDRGGACLGSHVCRHAAPGALGIANDHLAGHIVPRARARGNQHQYPEGRDQGEEAYRHWVRLGTGVYERLNRLPRQKL
jgi:hypothetical protein